MRSKAGSYASLVYRTTPKIGHTMDMQFKNNWRREN